MSNYGVSSIFLRLVLLTGISMLFFSCSGPADGQANDEQETSSAFQFVTEVNILPLQPTTFHLELISNGRLYARGKSRIIV